jgi:PAS domain S-box-containing protein
MTVLDASIKMAFKLFEAKIAERENELRLTRNERYLRSILQTTLDGFWIVDTDRRFIDVNDAYLRVSGYSREEFLRMTINDIDCDKDIETTERSMAQVKDIGAATFEKRHRTKDGRILDMAVSVTYLDSDGGRYIGFCRDISASKEKERALAESKERLAFALEATHDGLWDVNMTTNEVYLSPRDCEILGYSPDEAHELYKVWSELVNPEDMPRTQAALNETLEGRQPVFQVEQRLRTKSGAWKWVHTRGKVVERDESGQATRMTGTHTDISARKKAEEDFRETEDLFRLFLELSPIYVFFKDADIRALRLSRNYEKMLGMPVEEALGKDMFELFPSELSRSMVEDDKRLLREGKAIEVEEELAGRFYTTLKFPIFREGRTPLLGGFTIDITERKDAERRLQAALREKEILLSELQHRVNNTLTLVSSLLSLATASMPEGMGRDVLFDTQSRIESMQAIYELLCASPGIDEINLADYLGKLAEKFRSSWKFEDGYELEASFANIRAPVDTAIPLGLIFNELFTNAMKHAGMVGGSGRTLISVSLAERAGEIELRVSDSGPGFPAGFDPGSAESLGLKLVLSLASQLGGHASFKAGTGAEVVVLAPR